MVPIVSLQGCQSHQGTTVQPPCQRRDQGGGNDTRPACAYEVKTGTANSANLKQEDSDLDVSEIPLVLEPVEIDI